jgi:effector-binding domain-containing protein
MKNVLSVAISLMVVAMILGCGGEQPAKVEKPAEPVFVAQTTTVPAMKVASIAKMGPYAEAGKVVGDLMGIAQTEKLNVVGMPFGIYFDNPANVKPESTKYEVCVQVAPETKNKVDKKTGFAIKDAPEMMVATTEYMGPYDKVAPTYEKLYKWVQENKFEPAGPMIEWYLSDPAKVKPESLMAKIGAVVKPVAPPTDTIKKAEEPKKEEPKKEEVKKTEPKAPTKK